MKSLAAVLAMFMASLASAQTFRVSGTVIDSESGQSLGRSRVALLGGPGPERSTITAGNGEFSFDVPQGKYTLLVGHHDYGETYGQNRARTSDCSIVTGPEFDTTNIVVRWHAPIAIYGKVVDENREPVFNAKVELFVETVTGGKKRLVSLGAAETDEFGDYTWSYLAAGTYYLAATGEPWYFSDESVRAMLAEGGQPPSPYALTYFPTDNDPHGATPLNLRPGAEFRADFTLRPSVGADLHFVCSNSSCAGSLTLNVLGISETETLVRTTTITETATIPAVPSGRYVVRYTGNDTSMRKIIQVNGGEQTVEIVPKRASSLTGKVRLDNAQDHPLNQSYVTLINQEDGQATGTSIDATGSFSFPAVPASRWRVCLAGRDGLFIVRTLANGVNANDGVIELQDGSSVNINLTASAATAALKGFVMSSEKPVPMASVILLPANGSTDPCNYHAYETDSDGSFDFTAIPAGDYFLFAVSGQELEYANPEVVRPYLASAKRVSIKAHTGQTLHIELASDAHN